MYDFSWQRRPVVGSYNAGKYVVCPTCAGVGKGFGPNFVPMACPRCGGTGTIDLETDDPNLAPKELPATQRKMVGRFVR